MPNEAKVQRIVNVPKQYFWDRLRAFGEIKTLLPENILEVKLPDTFSDSTVSYTHLTLPTKA